MNKSQIVDLLCEINIKQYSGLEEMRTSVDQAFAKLNCKYEEIVDQFEEVNNMFFSDKPSIFWKYILLNFYAMQQINRILEMSDTELLSVQQTKNIKQSLKFFVENAIYSRLQPNLPFYIKNEEKIDDIFLNYNILKCTAYTLNSFIHKPDLRLLILPECLRAVLLAYFQITFCPLKSPDKRTPTTFTQQIYEELLTEKQMFNELLTKLYESIHPGIIIKETMILLQENSPVWFKKALSQKLTNILLSKNGVANIAFTMLDGVTNDTTQTWKALNTVTKLILSCRKLPYFKENICKQVVNLIDKSTSDNTLVYEKIFVKCTKSLYTEDCELCKSVFLMKVMSFFLYFTYNGYNFNEADVSHKIIQYIRLLHSIFINNNSEDGSNIPIDTIKPIVNVIFKFFCLVRSKSHFKSTESELHEILLEYIKTSHNFLVFDALIFNFETSIILPFRNDVTLKLSNTEIAIEGINHTQTISSLESAEYIMALVKDNTDILVAFFNFLLNCISNPDKYFTKANDELLNLETEIMNEYFERKLLVYKLLSEISEDKRVQTKITENPEDVTKYIKNVLKRSIELNIHDSTDNEGEAFQSIFTVIMILHALVSNVSNSERFEDSDLLAMLKIIHDSSPNKELKQITQEILNKLTKSENVKSTKVDDEDVKTNLDRALQDICDPLLPVRGHGLMYLTKLVMDKDSHVMERKQYILNIFQQNLKNEDSYIYLNAVNGLVALANLFPGTVVVVLCEEFSDYERKDTDGHEIRLKVGEALVKVTKLLGELTPKYKSILLNTFLVGVKDDDDLIRTSSLSNLGEICRVLGYKLGTIISEVLVCVHAVISTDKSQEARRAAVTVIRQLFVGLDSEIIAYMKEDILPIYRTLKQIYNNDKDDVMRLQAQLALEQLNENMKNIVFPKPELNMEKKIIMLD